MGSTRSAICLTRRGRVALGIAWLAVLWIGAATANIGVPGWGQ